MDLSNLEKLQQSFPFLSGLRYRDKEYICIIQNSDDKIISFYDYDSLANEVEKKAFLKYGDIWWWESNRLIPINIFYMMNSDNTNML